MLRPAIAMSLALTLLVPPNCHADLVGDAQNTINQLNPINIALNGLIGEAAQTVDTKLQQRLQQIQGIVELAIYELDQVAKNRIDQADRHVKEDIDKLNEVVRSSLLQFSSLVGKHLKDLDQNMLARIDQFNFGLANTIASVSFLNTIPLIKTDATGISTFKEAGGSTNLYIIGSGLKKSDDRPTAFLSGATVKSNYTTLWGVIREGIALDIPNASMGLLEVTIPNSLIPDDYGPTDFSLTLKLREGSNLVGWPKYSEQSIPLHVCGKLQKYKAVIAVWASGKQYVRDKRPLTDLIHGGCAGGRTNDSGNVCLPDQPPSGWEFDMADPDYGIVWQGSSFEGYVDYHHYGVGKRCMTCYCDGSQGNAHCNLMGLQMKIRRLADLDPCAAKWSSPEPIALTYGRLIQTDVHDQIVASGGSGGVGCDELKAQYAPTSHVTITILDSNGKVVETEDLREEIEATALSGAATFTRHSSGRIDMHLDPKCSWSPVPSGN